MDAEGRSHVRDLSASHLLPPQDFQSWPKAPQVKIARKPVPSVSSYESYQAVSSGEDALTLEKHGVDAGWPRGPKRLNEWTKSRCLFLFSDVIITLLPLIFLVLAICAIVLDHQPLSQFGANIIRGSQLGPTVFPVVFAALVGRLMRAVALWKAEKGAKLGLLEQLIGSQNLASALERIVLLRRYGLVELAIAALWLLSPLGGQSSLRMLDVVPAPVTSSANLQYFDVNATSNTMFTGADAMDSGGPTVSALFQASLLASQKVKDSPVDSWNNVKIPMLNELSPFTEPTATGTWMLVNQTTNWAYSSLSGLNVHGLPGTGAASFNMETSYVQLSCGDGVVYDSGNGTANETGYDYLFPEGLQYHNASDPFGSQSYFLDTSYRPTIEDNMTTPVNLLYGSQLALETDSMTLYNCTVLSSRVEAVIGCTGASCAAQALRRSLVDTRDPRLVPFVASSFEVMLIYFSTATGVGHEATTDPIDFYLLGYDDPFSPTTTDQSLRNYSNITGAYFEKRLSTLLNTWWQAGMAPFSIQVGADAIPTSNVTEVEANFEQPYYFANATTATVTNTIDVYHAPRLWTSILLITTLILHLCGIAGLVLKYTTTAPDILGYVSAMTRDNPYVAVPPGGNNLDGLERARYLKDMDVLIGDVKWDENVGHVAFHGVNQNHEWVGGPVRKRRLYV